jgi:hypothetical protein
MRGPRNVITMLISVSMALLLLGSVRWQYGSSIGDSGRAQTFRWSNGLPHTRAGAQKSRRTEIDGSLPRSPATTRSNRDFEHDTEWSFWLLISGMRQPFLRKQATSLGEAFQRRKSRDFRRAKRRQAKHCGG